MYQLNNFALHYIILTATLRLQLFLVYTTLHLNIWKRIHFVIQYIADTLNIVTILFKIITRMKLLFSNYLGGYSYSFRGASELISITVTVSLFFQLNALQERIPLGNSQEFSAITVTWFNGFWI